MFSWQAVIQSPFSNGGSPSEDALADTRFTYVPTVTAAGDGTDGSGGQLGQVSTAGGECKHLSTQVKKSLVREPGTSKNSIRTGIYFRPMSGGQVKKYSARFYFLECPLLFGNRTIKNLGVLVQRTSDHFKIFLPPEAYEACLTLHDFQLTDIVTLSCNVTPSWIL